MKDCCLTTNTHTHTYIYIYYIITVLVVTKSLCGFVSNQVQYNMESAQYLGSWTQTRQLQEKDIQRTEIAGI